MAEGSNKKIIEFRDKGRELSNICEKISHGMLSLANSNLHALEADCACQEAMDMLEKIDQMIPKMKELLMDIVE